jgi:hypothetical protein
LEVGGQLYSQGEIPWYPLNMRLGGHQSWSAQDGEVKILQDSNFDLLVIQPVVSHYTNCCISALGLGTYIDKIIGDQLINYLSDFSIHLILDKKWEYSETVQQLFMDLKEPMI